MKKNSSILAKHSAVSNGIISSALASFLFLLGTGTVMFFYSDFMLEQFERDVLFRMNQIATVIVGILFVTIMTAIKWKLLKLPFKSIREIVKGYTVSFGIVFSLIVLRLLQSSDIPNDQIMSTSVGFVLLFLLVAPTLVALIGDMVAFKCSKKK